MKKIMWIIALAAVSLYVAAGIVYMYQKGATIRIMVIFAIFILIGNILIIVSECKKIKSMELAAGIVYFMAVMILILKNDESMVDISDLVVYAMIVLASTCSASYLFVKGKIKKGNGVIDMNKAYFENILQLIRNDFEFEFYLADSIMNSSEFSRILIEEKLYGHMLANGYFTGLAEAERWKYDLSQKYYGAKQLIKELEGWGLKGSFAVIKGCALNCMIYGDKEIRPFGDLDILIDPSEAQHFHEILQEYTQ